MFFWEDEQQLFGYLDFSSPNILGFHRIFLNHRDLTWECGYGIVWVNHNEGTT